MDLDPDTLRQAVEAAAAAIHEKFQMYYGQQVDEETVFTAMAEAAYPVIAAAVERRTADAISQQIEMQAKSYHAQAIAEGSGPLQDAANYTYDAARIARWFLMPPSKHGSAVTE